MIAKRLIVRGRVQGVGFRESMVDAASALGIVGWVRNRQDGAVEALVQGDADAVEGILAWCRRGPPAARVTSVATLAVPADPARATAATRAMQQLARSNAFDASTFRIIRSLGESRHSSLP